MIQPSNRKHITIGATWRSDNHHAHKARQNEQDLDHAVRVYIELDLIAPFGTVIVLCTLLAVKSDVTILIKTDIAMRSVQPA